MKKWILFGVLIFSLILISGCAEGGEEQTPELTGEIIGKGTEGIEIKISPAAEDNTTIKGRVTVSLTMTPANTGTVAFLIKEGSLDLTSEEIDLGDTIGLDLDGSDGWSRLLDTTRYSNGIYEIIGMPGTEIGEPPLGYASAQVVIENN
jgi:hypothetical protein